MRFDWDHANTKHLGEHGVAPEEFEQAFQNDPLRLSRSLHHRERRYAALGESDAGRVLAFVYTKRGRKIPGDNGPHRAKEIEELLYPAEIEITTWRRSARRVSGRKPQKRHGGTPTLIESCSKASITYSPDSRRRW